MFDFTFPFSRYFHRSLARSLPHSNCRTSFSATSVSVRPLFIIFISGVTGLLGILLISGFGATLRAQVSECGRRVVLSNVFLFSVCSGT